MSYPFCEVCGIAVSSMRRCGKDYCAFCFSYEMAEPATPALAGERVAKMMRVMGENNGRAYAILSKQVKGVIADANAARQNGDREYKLYIRKCVAQREGNLITLF